MNIEGRGFSNGKQSQLLRPRSNRFFGILTDRADDIESKHGPDLKRSCHASHYCNFIY